jgi:hypothetical protein
MNLDEHTKGIERRVMDTALIDTLGSQLVRGSTTLTALKNFHFYATFPSR